MKKLLSLVVENSLESIYKSLRKEILNIKSRDVVYLFEDVQTKFWNCGFGRNKEENRKETLAYHKLIVLIREELLKRVK